MLNLKRRFGQQNSTNKVSLHNVLKRRFGQQNSTNKVCLHIAIINMPQVLQKVLFSDLFLPV